MCFRQKSVEPSSAHFSLMRNITHMTHMNILRSQGTEAYFRFMRNVSHLNLLRNREKFFKCSESIHVNSTEKLKSKFILDLAFGSSMASILYLLKTFEIVARGPWTHLRA
jgi:hypothetical protein